MAEQLGAQAKARENESEAPGAADEADEGAEFKVDLFRSSDSVDESDGSSARADASTTTDDPPRSDSPDEVTAHRGRDQKQQTRSEPAVRSAKSEAASVDGAGDSVRANVLDRLWGRPRGQLRARKVQRIVRRVDPWSVLKVSLLFYFCVWLMVLVSVVLVWGAAMSSGTVGSLESFIAEFLAFEEFRFNGDQLFQIFALGGLIGVFVATAVTAILAVLFNLIADLTGGIRFTVIEEESARRIISQK